MTNLKTINRNITNIRTNGVKWNNLVQTTIEMIAEHAQGEGRGDVSAMVRLFFAMPKSSKRTALVTYIAEYTPIRLAINLKEPEKSRASLAKPGTKGCQTWDMDGLKANPWYEHSLVTEEKLPETFLEFDKGFYALLNTWTNKMKEGKVKDTSVAIINAKMETLKAAYAAVKTNDNGEVIAERAAAPAA